MVRRRARYRLTPNAGEDGAEQATLHFYGGRLAGTPTWNSPGPAPGRAMRSDEGRAQAADYLSQPHQPIDRWKALSHCDPGRRPSRQKMKERELTVIYRLKEYKGDSVPVPQLVFNKLGIAEEYSVRVEIIRWVATGITDRAQSETAQPHHRRKRPLLLGGRRRPWSATTKTPPPARTERTCPHDLAGESLPPAAPTPS